MQNGLRFRFLESHLLKDRVKMFVASHIDTSLLGAKLANTLMLAYLWG